MKVPWFRRDFQRRRQLDRLFLDLPDAALRAVTGRRHLPPYSLRAYVGGAQGFDEVAHWFLVEFRRLRLFMHDMRVLDIGCGCGRIAYGIATDPDLRDFVTAYTGMDIDRTSVEWCQRHITPLRAGFTFYRADRRNASYNPGAAGEAEAYRFPHSDSSFELILLTSVLTHVLEEELRPYLEEVARMLAPGGVAYATFFLYGSAEELAGGIPRHGIRFQPPQGRCAVNRHDHPANAVAYEEVFVREVAREAGLAVIEPTLYGSQDVLLLTKAASQHALLEGWYQEEGGCFRWTERVFSVRLAQPRGGASELRFRFRLPEAILQETGSVRLKASIDGVNLPECAYSTGGDHVYVQRVPQTPRQDSALVRFEIDKAYGPKASDPRTLALQVVFRSRCGGAWRGLSPVYLA
jgi:SAM-dependent methyltransferase